MTLKPYCVMASFATADDDVWHNFSVLVEAATGDEARQRGRERIIAQVSPESTWGGEVMVYDTEQLETLRRLGIFQLRRT